MIQESSSWSTGPSRPSVETIPKTSVVVGDLQFEERPLLGMLYHGPTISPAELAVGCAARHEAILSD